MAGSIDHIPCPHFCINMATNIVQSIKNDAILVLKPRASSKPPTASEKAPIQAKKTGKRAKIPPYSATSLGNQATTSKKPKFAVLDQGKPNLSDPKLKVSNIPQTNLGIVNSKSANQCFCSIGVISVFNTCKIRVFIIEIFNSIFVDTNLALNSILHDLQRIRWSYIRFETSYLEKVLRLFRDRI